MYTSQNPLPEYDEARCSEIQTGIEEEPLVDKEAYHELVHEACRELILDLTVHCTWASLGEDAFDEMLKDFYQHELADLIHRHHVIDDAWGPQSPGTPEEQRDAFAAVSMATMDEIGARYDLIIRRAKQIFLETAEYVQVRVRRGGIEVVNLYSDKDNAGMRNYLEQRIAERYNAPLR